jgi:general secretion pathway protein M
MIFGDTVTRAGDAWAAFWKVRNRRERSMLVAAMVVCVLGAVYVLLIDPAVSGASSLRKSLPLLRQQAAQVRQLAGQLAQQSEQRPDRRFEQDQDAQPAPPLALSGEAIQASLKRVGLNATGVEAAEGSARLQFTSVSLVGLIAWLEQAQGQDLPIAEADIQTLPNSETAKATVTLTQRGEERQ